MLRAPRLPDHESPQQSVRLMAYSAAAMYGGALFLSIVEGFTPGGSSFAPVPGVVAFVIVVLIVTLGPRAPRMWLAPLGFLGAALIGYALSGNAGPGDGAVLYIWPVLWMSYFFGRRGTAWIIAWIGAVHWAVLRSLPTNAGFVDRWIDVMVVLGVIGFVISMLSERDQKLVLRLQDEARIDPLTALLNRRGFDERVPSELARAFRANESISIVTLDVDRFKNINDEWGHECGDRVLAALGQTLRQCARATDLLARIGGEEFVALLPGADAVAGRMFAERVREAVARNVEPGLPHVTVSAGVASAVAPTELETLLRDADYALYAAKRSGRNRTLVHPLGRGMTSGVLAPHF